MKSWTIIGRIAAGMLVLVAFGLSSSAEGAVGRTPGTYRVSPSGAATYTIPIWAPRGPNGLQPHMALTYSSHSGAGYLGVGWNLSGLSSIYRCNQTYAQDAAPAPVTLTMSDVFCMDGRRLRLTGGTYGAAGSTYQTEIANFSNVTAYGAAGNGPAYFEVQGRDGRTYEYGNSGGSQVVASGTTTAWIWYLDKVTDRAGNTMAITYCAAVNPNCASIPDGASDIVPSKIYWTPTSYGAATYNYTMEFAYTDNVPQSSTYGYVGGTPYSNTSLLASISVLYSGTTVKQYALSYEQSGTTGRDELVKLQECADAAETNCLAPTQFTYQSGQIGTSTSPITAFSASMLMLAVHEDFNGDGLNDIAYCSVASPSVIYVAFSSPGGYGSPVNTGIACNNPLYGDLTASGKDGILAPNGTDWWYYTWNGSSFAGQDTGLAYDSTASQYVLADVNGDGLPDLISSYVQTGGTSNSYNIYVRLNASQGGSGALSFSGSNNLWYGPIAAAGVDMISSTESTGPFIAYGTLKALDFNGDGRQDIALEISNRGATQRTSLLLTEELISGSSSFTAVPIVNTTTTANLPVTFLDFNSDECTDYAFNGTIYISGCNGTVPQQISLGATIVGAIDWDGDGRTDILVQNGSTIGVYLSEGNGISGLQATSIAYNSSNLYFALDVNGDGLDDLGVAPSSGTGAVSYYLHNGAGQKPDLLTSATDGYGNSVSPAYTTSWTTRSVWRTRPDFSLATKLLTGRHHSLQPTTPRQQYYRRSVSLPQHILMYVWRAFSTMIHTLRR